MENAPDIILLWLFILADFALMITAGVGTFVWLRKGKGTARIWGGICLAVSILCAIPIALAVGYVLYLHLG